MAGGYGRAQGAYDEMVFRAMVRDKARFYSPLGLESEDFAQLTRLVLQVADTHAQGRLVSCLEGGYDLEALAESVQVHLEELVVHSEGTRKTRQ